MDCDTRDIINSINKIENKVSDINFTIKNMDRINSTHLEIIKSQIRNASYYQFVTMMILINTFILILIGLSKILDKL